MVLKCFLTDGLLVITLVLYLNFHVVKTFHAWLTICTKKSMKVLSHKICMHRQRNGLPSVCVCVGGGGGGRAIKATSCTSHDCYNIVTIAMGCNTLYIDYAF